MAFSSFHCTLLYSQWGNASIINMPSFFSLSLLLLGNLLFNYPPLLLVFWGTFIQSLTIFFLSSDFPRSFCAIQPFNFVYTPFSCSAFSLTKLNSPKAEATPALLCRRFHFTRSGHFVVVSSPLLKTLFKKMFVWHDKKWLAINRFHFTPFTWFHFNPFTRIHFIFELWVALFCLPNFMTLIFVKAQINLLLSVIKGTGLPIECSKLAHITHSFNITGITGVRGVLYTCLVLPLYGGVVKRGRWWPCNPSNSTTKPQINLKFSHNIVKTL